MTTITAVGVTISEQLVIKQASFKELTGAEVANFASPGSELQNIVAEIQNIFVEIQNIVTGN